MSPLPKVEQKNKNLRQISKIGTRVILLHFCAVWARIQTQNNCNFRKSHPERQVEFPSGELTGQLKHGSH